MAYNSDNRSERLLQGRRFTTDNLSLGQEAFTDVFDLGAGEILTDDGLIPTGSTQLPYSGSSQNGEIVSGSVVNPSIGTDVNVLKYHYRKKLKQAADGQREVYYFTTSDPSDISDTVTSDQLIETDQQTNFVSPKYIIASDSPNNTESSTPGYKVVVYKDTASSAGSITSSPSDPASYVFDFKTGVLTWVGSNQPSSNQFVYITAYQYIGRTLRSQIDDGSIGGSGGASSFAELSGKPAGLVSGSVQVNADSITNFDTNVKDKLNTEGVISGSSQIVITESQISDLQSYLTSLPAGTISGSSQVTITESQISDLQSYLTSLPSGTISGSSQISITESQISDLQSYLTSLPAGTISSSAQITSSDLDMGGNKVLFSNVYSQLADLPSASTYHGMFAHVHATGKGYFAHSGNWVELANSDNVNALTGSINSLTAATSSYLTSLPGGVISGSAGIVAGLVGQNLNIGELTATKVVTNIVSQSISFASGSTKFGDELTDEHQMTGSLSLSGSFSFSEIDGGNF